MIGMKCRGAFSVVHAAKSKEDGQLYAVKMADKETTKVADMAQELAIMAEVRHPNIVNFKEVFDCPTTYNVVLELYVPDLIYSFTLASREPHILDGPPRGCIFGVPRLSRAAFFQWAPTAALG
jgi:serine/threonine protein kinase